MKTLWCKNQENLSDRISHAWAPLMTCYRVKTDVNLPTVSNGNKQKK
jgi:hypothetical protein